MAARQPGWLPNAPNRRGSGPAQPIQDRRRGKPIGNKADLGLVLAQRRAGAAAELTVRRADIETVACQLLLQFKTLIARQHALVAGPWLHDRLTPRSRSARY